MVFALLAATLKPQPAVQAGGMIPVDQVELDVFDRVAERASAAVADSNVTVNLDSGHLIN